MDDATGTVLMREMAENRQNRQLAQLYQGVAGLLHEAASLDGAPYPLEPRLAQAPEPAVLAQYAQRLEVWLIPVRARKAAETAAQAQPGPPQPPTPAAPPAENGHAEPALLGPARDGPGEPVEDVDGRPAGGAP